MVLCLAAGLSLLTPAVARAANFTVDNTGDAGDAAPGDGVADIGGSFGGTTLRAAIEEANALAGIDSVDFSPSILPLVLTPGSPLPIISDPSGGLTIDGGKQVRIDAGGTFGPGLYIASANNVIANLAIVNANDATDPGAGIYINGTGATGNVVRGCELGFIGVSAAGNDAAGILISNASGNTIGGTTAADRNVISGNTLSGILIQSSGSSIASNKVIGNYIGTDAAGTSEIPNGQHGIRIRDGSSIRIGGTAAGEGNVISGNASFGIRIEAFRGSGSSIDNHTIQGNLIGTSASGDAAVGNGTGGVEFETTTATESASNNTVGGTSAAARNVISGNGGNGLSFSGPGTTSNTIQGNFIGTDSTGAGVLDNLGNGISFTGSTSSNVAGGDLAGEGNIIANSALSGILVDGSVTHFNSFERNSIYNSGVFGIQITGGGNDSVAPPVITNLSPVTGTSNPGDEVEIFADLSDEGQTFLAQVITDAGGGFSTVVDLSPYDGQNLTATKTDALGNTSVFGVAVAIDFPDIVTQPADDVVVEGDPASFQVVMSVGPGGFTFQWEYAADGVSFSPLANDTTHSGVTTNTLSISPTVLGDSGSYRCVVTNAQGLTTTSDAAVLDVILPDLSDVTVDTAADVVDGNISSISQLRADKGADGFISLREAMFACRNTPGADAIDTTLSDATITLLGGASLPNINDTTGGVNIDGGGQITIDGSGVTPGGSGFIITSADNTLRGMNVLNLSGNGIYISGLGAMNNTVAGCGIGTNADADFGNGLAGVLIDGGATNNVIGGTTTADRNIISGNDVAGIEINDAGTDGNQVIGNFIGTDDNGLAALPNGIGVMVNGGTNNVIGGNGAGEGNLVSGNSTSGVELNSVSGDTIQGNIIGLDVTGTVILGNGETGVWLDAAANNNIGGNTAGARNIISGNNGGLRLTGTFSTGNTIRGNYIGTDISGTSAAGNLTFGISVEEGSSNTLGGAGAGTGNVVSGNGGTGIVLADASDNIVRGNLIGTNAAGTLALGNSVRGISIEGLSGNNILGGAAAGAGNLISGNSGHGIFMGFSNVQGTSILGNKIGVDAAGTGFLSNNGSGIFLDATSDNVVGGVAAGEANIIAGNALDGVTVDSGVRNAIRGNSIHANLEDGIDLLNGGNVGFAAPVITDTGPVTGTAPANATIDIFVDTEGEGRVYKTTVVADASGNFNSGVNLEPDAGNNVTATATNGNGNTSEFSAPFLLEPQLVVDGPGLDFGDVEAGQSSDLIIHFHNDGVGNLSGSATAPAPFSIVAGGTYNLAGGQGQDVTVRFAPGGAGDFAENITFTGGGGASLPLTGTGVVAPNFTQQPASQTVVEGDTVVFSVAATGTAPITYRWRYRPVGGAFSNMSNGGGVSGALSPTLTLSSVATTRTGDYLCAATNGVGTTNSNIATLAVVDAATASVTVDTLSNASDGDTSSIAALIASRGADGFISLREAMTAANNTAGSNIITFSVSGTIAPSTALPALADITGGTSIIASNNITVSGGSLSAGQSVFRLNSAGNSLQFLAAINAPASGVEISGAGATNNSVLGCRIGNDAGAAQPNLIGVHIHSGATQNVLGGATADQRNIISGNTEDGVRIRGAGTRLNQVINCYIGTNTAGTGALANGISGVHILEAASENTAGGATADQRNVISGNAVDGVHIESGSNANIIIGNYIGTDNTGLSALGNTFSGVVQNGSSSNRIGGSNAGEGNVISGNGFSGIRVETCTDTEIRGNLIGAAGDGASAVPNTDAGIHVGGGSTGTIIGGNTAVERNIISGNTGNGIEIHGFGTSANTLTGNYIGVNSAGTSPLPNGGSGVSVYEAATTNQIGDNTSPLRNVISGNANVGVLIKDSGTTGNVVENNYIGTTITGNAAVANGTHGILITNSASGNTIGGTTPGARNVISGNTRDGIRVVDAASNSNIIRGNRIGVNSAGTPAVANLDNGVSLFGGSGTIVGGTVAGAGNLISGNSDDGIRIA
ncbi:MAG: immunoglobulin domain-containing protein, partial [Candidatus Hydrogenedentes bacterium]|nr:immunoglobulin domain-containing protein [Candidatus Hydrogenedentota bacterium]